MSWSCSRHADRTRRSGIAGLVCVGLAVGCAPIDSGSTVRVIPKPDTQPVVLATGHGPITARGAELAWQQRGSTLAVQIHETRRCRQVWHDPVIRIEEIERKAGGALYWEYGIAAATLGLGLAALIRPEPFSPELVNGAGERIVDRRGGYRIGGIFTGLGAIALGAGIYDTVRARDSVHYVDAYRVRLGDSTPCPRPKELLVDAPVELIIDEWSAEARTDETGLAIFELPEQGEDLDDEEPVSSPTLRKAVIALDSERVLTIDYMTPFEAAQARDHRGQTAMEPSSIPTPPRPRTPASSEDRDG